MCMTAFSSDVLLLQPILYLSMHVTSAIGQHKMKYSSNLLSFHTLFWGELGGFRGGGCLAFGTVQRRNTLLALSVYS